MVQAQVIQGRGLTTGGRAWSWTPIFQRKTKYDKSALINLYHVTNTGEAALEGVSLNKNALHIFLKCMAEVLFKVYM